jgi:hypothetical protein
MARSLRSARVQAVAAGLLGLMLARCTLNPQPLPPDEVTAVDDGTKGGFTPPSPTTSTGGGSSGASSGGSSSGSWPTSPEVVDAAAGPNQDGGRNDESDGGDASEGGFPDAAADAGSSDAGSESDGGRR